MVHLRLAAVCMVASHVIITAACATPRSLPIPALAGCGRSLPNGQAVGTVSNVKILSGGVQRSYLISIPPNYNVYTPTPIILSYHGGVRTAEDQLQLDQLSNSEFNTDSLVVYPQGINVRLSYIVLNFE